MNIKSKLLTFIGGAFIILLLATFSVLLILTANKIRINLTSELNSQTESITTQVGDLITSSARSYLMAAGDQADLISQKFFELSQEDVLSEEDSKRHLFETINSFTFLTEGYIYITDKNGIIINHPNPEVINTESTINSWLQTLNPDDNSFYTYDYHGRNKLLYRVYNKDLNINICTTAYTSDLLKVIDLDELNKAMNSTKIGTTGYPFLMDSDGVYITHPNKDYLNNSQLNLEDADGNKIVQRIINEGEGSFEYNWLEPNGKIREKFVYFRTDRTSELIIAASGYEEDFYAVVYDIRNIIIVSGVVVISILLLIIYIMSGSITKSIVSFTENLKDVSDGNGDLTKRITLTSKDEIGTMVHYFNNFLSTLQNIIIEIKKSADLTIEIKNEIAYGVDETSAALYEISTNIEGINNQTQYLNNNVKASADSIIKINSNIDDLNNSIDTQSLMLETSTAAITEMISSIDNVSKITTAKQASAKELILRAKEGSEVISNTLNAVQDVSNQLLSIKEMADLISGISSQTNLLAMNAAIEAAHAGDAGKGFAVVADEIRKLAETSSLNSTQITNTLKKVESSILLASNLSNKTSESFGMVNSEIVEIVGALQEIDNSTNELQIGGKDILESITGLEGASNIVKEKSVSIKLESESVRKSMDDTKNITLEVVTAIDEINQGTKGISESMEGVSTTSYKLKETGENLSNNVNRFKTK